MGGNGLNTLSATSISSFLLYFSGSFVVHVFGTSLQQELVVGHLSASEFQPWKKISSSVTKSRRSSTAWYSRAPLKVSRCHFFLACLPPNLRSLLMQLIHFFLQRIFDLDMVLGVYFEFTYNCRYFLFDFALEIWLCNRL